MTKGSLSCSSTRHSAQYSKKVYIIKYIIFLQRLYYKHEKLKGKGEDSFDTPFMIPSPNVSTNQLRQWGFQQCLPFSWTTLRDKHYRHPIAVMGVVDTFEQSHAESMKKPVAKTFFLLIM